MTRFVRDTAIMLQALSGHDSRDTSALRSPVPDFVSGLTDGVTGKKIGWSVNLGIAPADPSVEKALKDAAVIFEGMGAIVEEAPIKIDTPPSSYWMKVWCVNQVAMYGHLVESNLDELMHYTVAMNYEGLKITAADYARALKEAEVFRTQMADYFEDFDLLILPTTAVTAYPHRTPPTEIAGAPVRSLAGIPYGVIPTTMAFNIGWNPAASVPIGFDPDGMPIGMQIVGDFHDEVSVLQASASFEEAQPWASALPPMS